MTDEERAIASKKSEDVTQMLFDSLEDGMPLVAYWQGVADFLILTNKFQYNNSKKKLGNYCKFLEYYRKNLSKAPILNEE